MSRQTNYLARAAQLDALADSADYPSARVLRQVAAHWRQLAELEARTGNPTRWDHSSPSAPQGVYRTDN